MMEELKQLESLHLLKSLGTSHCYKEYLVRQIVKQKKKEGKWRGVVNNGRVECAKEHPSAQVSSHLSWLQRILRVADSEAKEGKWRGVTDN